MLGPVQAPGEQTPMVTQRLPSECAGQQTRDRRICVSPEDHTFSTASIKEREGPNVCSRDANPGTINLLFLSSLPEHDAPGRNPLNGV